MKKKNDSPKQKKKRFPIATAVVCVVLIAATVLCSTTFRSILDTVLGGKHPKMDSSVEKVYTSDYASKKEAKEAGDQINLEIAKEGFTLLVNEKDALPLAQTERKVSVFGKNSVDLVLSGSGSGKVNGDDAKTIFQKYYFDTDVE